MRHSIADRRNLATGLVAALLTVVAPQSGAGATSTPDDVAQASNTAGPLRADGSELIIRRRPVFVCRAPDSVTYADRPCGELWEARTLRVPDPGPGAAPTVIAPAPRAATKPRGSAGVTAGRPAPDETQCRRLLDERDLVNSRMRAGYGARQAAELWSRWRAVQSAIYAARC